MPLPRHIRSYSNDQDGLALIIVLAFIVLITILLVSFVSFTQLNHQSTASYSKAIQTQEIAQGGLLEIVGDLHQEILAGSTASSATPKVYLPTTNLTAVPAASVTTPLTIPMM